MENCLTPFQTLSNSPVDLLKLHLESKCFPPDGGGGGVMKIYHC